MLLAQGVAIMVVNPDDRSPWAQTKQLWNDPTNPDSAFFRVLFQELNSGAYGAIDTQRIILNGWSTGAHFVSWMINLWAAKHPVLAGINITAGVFLSGGSHRCFDTPLDPMAPALTDCTACNASAQCFVQREHRGTGCSSALLAKGTAPCCEMCCPANVTEDYYLVSGLQVQLQ
jgi:poly(3-hydroxybutyrate) depolymerase